ncbi:hypothetical protein GGX14DRAFT_576648 [Mycena pura]|uniref:Uncharacterized protein n=1 Tax=Mycena pura TaxID=153505 RepID=A0AAD6XZQ9_9AGAR|nr:hypothetical protein GGX14DRAFT_576648 [Mycena pura]
MRQEKARSQGKPGAGPGRQRKKSQESAGSLTPVNAKWLTILRGILSKIHPDSRARMAYHTAIKSLQLEKETISVPKDLIKVYGIGPAMVKRVEEEFAAELEFRELAAPAPSRSDLEERLASYSTPKKPASSSAKVQAGLSTPRMKRKKDTVIDISDDELPVTPRRKKFRREVIEISDSSDEERKKLADINKTYSASRRTSHKEKSTAGHQKTRVAVNIKGGESCSEGIILPGSDNNETVIDISSDSDN